jgi:hypothetical protein
MNPGIRTRATLLVIALIAGCLSQQAIADDPKCRNANGDLSVVSTVNGTTSGTIRHGGKLNGTTRAVFTSALTSTPNPNAFSYTDEFSITTDRGVLKAHNVGLFVVSNGQFSEIAIIDPSVSTGDFATATGVLYINGKTSDGGATFKAEITGEFCVAD